MPSGRICKSPKLIKSKTGPITSFWKKKNDNRCRCITFPFRTLTSQPHLSWPYGLERPLWYRKWTVWSPSCSPSSVVILLVKVRIDIYCLYGKVPLSACFGSLTLAFLVCFPHRLRSSFNSSSGIDMDVIFSFLLRNYPAVDISK